MVLRPKSFPPLLHPKEPPVPSPLQLSPVTGPGHSSSALESCEKLLGPESGCLGGGWPGLGVGGGSLRAGLVGAV